jgi:hypothetical protein
MELLIHDETRMIQDGIKMIQDGTRMALEYHHEETNNFPDENVLSIEAW